MALVSFLGQHIFSECTEIGLAPYCLCGSQRRLWSNTYLESYAVDCTSGCISCRTNSDFDNSVHLRSQKSQRVHSVTAKSTQMLSGWPRSEHSIFSLRAHGHVFDRIGGHLNLQDGKAQVTVHRLLLAWPAVLAADAAAAGVPLAAASTRRAALATVLSRSVKFSRLPESQNIRTLECLHSFDFALDHPLEYSDAFR